MVCFPVSNLSIYHQAGITISTIECSVALLTDNPRYLSLLMFLFLGRDCHPVVLICPLSHNLRCILSNYLLVPSRNPDLGSNYREFC